MKHQDPPFQPAVEYVLGFAFTPSRGGVLGIKKTRPVWQAGRVNGVGGKIEPDDWCIEDAMTREFLEETGIATQESQWQLFGSHVRPGDFNLDPHSYTLHLLTTVLSPEQCQSVQLVTDEEPIWQALSQIPIEEHPKFVSGFGMYVAMALNHLGKQFVTQTIELAEQP